MKCIDCKFYEGREYQHKDLCLNPYSSHMIGGIRHERIRQYHTCDSMLTGVCLNHRLYESLTLRDEYPEKYAQLKRDENEQSAE